MPRKRSPKTAEDDRVTSIIREEAEKLSNDYQPDPEFDERNVAHGPAYFREAVAARDERIIDQLLASAPRSQGYYLKLYREVGPGAYEYKMRIDNYENWSDLEHEIAQIVKYMTKKHPTKWGSGVYKVVIWNDNGMRGDGYPPYFFTIDAEDNDRPQTDAQVPHVDPKDVINDNITLFANMINAIKGITPPPPNPSETNKQLAESFQLGMQAAGSTSNQSTQMMMMLMTTMLGMMKEFAASMKQQPVPVDTPRSSPSDELAKTLTMMKSLGVLPEPQRQDPWNILRELNAIGVKPFKSQDPIEQVKQLKDVFSMFRDLMGSVERGEADRPSIAEKLIDVLGPQVSHILDNLTQMSNNYVRLKSPSPAHGTPLTPQQIPPAHQPLEQPAHDALTAAAYADLTNFQKGGEPGNGQPTPPPSQPFSPTSSPQEPQPSHEEDENTMMLQRLLTAIQTNDAAFYPTLYQSIVSVPQGQELIDKAIDGLVTIDHLIQLVHMWGGARFADPSLQPALRDYIRGFLAWINDQLAAHERRGVCSKCGEEYSVADDITEPQFCDNVLEVNGVTEPCNGTITVI